MEKKGEGHSSPNPFPSLTWMAAANPCEDGRSLILSGLQINEVLGGASRTWCWMVVMDAPSVEVFQDSFLDF